MHSSNHHLHRKPLVFASAVIALVAMLVVSLITTSAGASSIVSVSSNIANVPDGEDLVLRVGTQNDGDVYELEVDHSLQSVLPEFSVYADEADPYGGDPDFAAAGVEVTYSTATSEWVIDFGPTVTQTIRDNGGAITFYLVLRDADGTILWGSMDQITPENTFDFDLEEGTGDSLVPEQEEDEEVPADDAPVPGVPNTATTL